MDYLTPSANIIRLFYAAKVVNRKVKGNQKRNGCLMAFTSKCSKLSRAGKEAELLFSTLLLRTNHKSGRETMKQIN